MSESLKINTSLTTLNMDCDEMIRNEQEKEKREKTEKMNKCTDNCNSYETRKQLLGT